MLLTAIISCGGKSSRMGSDKSLLNYHGVSQREFLYDSIIDYCSEVYFSINDNQSSRLPFFKDDIEFGSHGPVSGLLTAMKKLPGKDILYLGCDYPGVSGAEIKYFLSSLVPGKPAAFYNPLSGFYEPVLGYYPAQCYPSLVEDFRSGNYSLQNFLKNSNANKFIPENMDVMKSIDDPHTFTSWNIDKSTREVRILKKDGDNFVAESDYVAIEEPLEIKLSWIEKGKQIIKSIAVTMRTPGNDPELALGFLFSEGIIKTYNDIGNCKIITQNEVLVTITNGFVPELKKAERNFYATSSCGVCGKSGIDQVKVFSGVIKSKLSVKSTIISELPDKLRQQQAIFKETGGLHGCALFTHDGQMILLREDVGRHNALDKLIGSCFQNMELPLDNCILLLSGRASFELIQKAAMCGIPVVAAIGAPSSLAVNLAEESGVTLAGFVKNGRFNIYTSPHRITN